MRYYSSVASLTQLVGAISASDTSMIVGSTTGLPAQVPFTLLLDEGTVAEEIVTVTNAAGSTLTITRGEDGTVGTAHGAGCRVRHAMTARDLRESRQHEDASTGVHGVAGAVVGTTDAQTLSNKTLDAADGNNFANVPVASIVPNAGAVADTDSLQTFTNKNIDGATNNLTNLPKTALPNDVAYIHNDIDWDGNHVFTAPGTGSVPVTIKSISGFTANLFEVELAGSATPVVSIDQDGNLDVPGLTVAGDDLPARLDEVASLHAQVYEASDGSNVTTNSATAEIGTPVVGVAFVAPTSGKVLVSLGGDVQPGAGATCVLAFKVRQGAVIGSGAEIVNGDIGTFPRLLSSAGRIAAEAGSITVSDLTPGSTYNAHTVHYSASAGGSTLRARRITVRPL